MEVIKTWPWKIRMIVQTVICAQACQLGPRFRSVSWALDSGLSAGPWIQACQLRTGFRPVSLAGPWNSGLSAVPWIQAFQLSWALKLRLVSWALEPRAVIWAMD